MMKRGAQLLDTYIRQGLTAKERYELEKLALDDPLLAEAWEGLSAPYGQDHSAALQRLKVRLSSSQAPEAKVVPMYKKVWPYAVAASLIMVMTIGLLLRQTNIDNNSAGSLAVQIDDRLNEDNQGGAIAMMDEQAQKVVELQSHPSQDVIQQKGSATKSMTTQVNQSKPTPHQEPKVVDANRPAIKAKKVAANISLVEEEVITERGKKEPPVPPQDPIADARHVVAEDTELQSPITDAEEDSPLIAIQEIQDNPLVKENLAAVIDSDSRKVTLKRKSDDDNGIFVANVTELPEALGTGHQITILNTEGTGLKQYVVDRQDLDSQLALGELLVLGNEGDTFVLNNIADNDLVGNGLASALKVREFESVGHKNEIAFQNNEMGQEPMPANGFETYKKEINEYVKLTKEELFMKGIKGDLVIRVQFQINEEGVPSNIFFPTATMNDIVNRIKDAMKQASPWINFNPEELIKYTVVLEAN